ncbi:MAG: squalene/phytoene synthase family protein [Salinibacter sp.]
MSYSNDLTTLRPFYDNWWGARRSSAHALWAFHSALTDPVVPEPQDDRPSVEAFFDEERDRAKAGASLHVVPEPVWRRAYEACRDHELDQDLLGAQVEAARTFVGRVRFASANTLETFVRLWAVPHARLLAALADLRLSAQRRHVDELARGFFFLGRLLTLPEDVQENRLFVPKEELDWADVSVGQLQDGRVTEGLQRLLWKQSVRVRDALAQGAPLLSTLSVRRKYVLKYYWMGALALLNELERRDFDLWTAPASLSWFRQSQVYLQVLFGRTSIR